MVIHRRYRLTYPLGLLDKPILYTLIRRFDILTNIRSASVSDKDGWLIVDMEGEEAEVEAGVAWAREQGVKVTETDRPS
jgi:ABC-type methionine transport system ATPase subunit